MAWRNRQLTLVLSQAAAVTTPSKFVRDKFHEFGLDTSRWRVVPYGLDENTMPSSARASAGRDSEHLRVAYVGGLSWQKGVHVLVEAFNGLAPSTHLTIAGPLNAFPDYVAHLRTIAQHPNITFVDALTRNEVWQLLSRTDVVVVPSMWHETASLIAREAISAGCRLIASDVGALREVAEAHGGVLVPPGDVPALQEALRRQAVRCETIPHESPAPHWIPSFRSTADYATDCESIYQAALPRT
jgi:glycosyltransferase involved in cell wall biosynthesis